MVNRINLLLKAKNITARQFAESIGVQPSSMSHILSGRNNPSLDFVMKVIRRYPEIDINWLMFGKGEMYETHGVGSLPHTATQPVSVASSRPASTPAKSPKTVALEQNDLFSQPNENRVNDPVPNPVPVDDNVVASTPAPVDKPEQPVVDTAEAVAPVAPAPTPTAQPSAQPTPVVVPKAAEESKPEAPQVERRLVRLLAFYDDHTFVEYRPQ